MSSGEDKKNFFFKRKFCGKFQSNGGLAVVVCATTVIWLGGTKDKTKKMIFSLCLTNTIFCFYFKYYKVNELHTDT